MFYSFKTPIENGENGWFVGQIEELPTVISQGKTVPELNSNLLDALNLYLETQKELTELDNTGGNFSREELVLAQ